MYMTDNECRALISAAIHAREKSYAPYSHFRVGAALRTADGRIYEGCNIENAAYSATVCAERTAIFKAVSEGERHFTAIAIVGGREGEELNPTCAPCGVCRQVMAEFCPLDMPVVLGTEAHFEVHTLEELLPLSFGPADL